MMVAPDWYVASRIGWDTSRQPDEIMTDFYARAFGSAASQMRNFYQLLERLWLDKMHTGFRVFENGFGPFMANEAEQWEIYTPELLDLLETFLTVNATQAAGGDADVIERIEHLRQRLILPIRTKRAIYDARLAIVNHPLATNLVENPSFEAAPGGDPEGWSVPSGELSMDPNEDGVSVDPIESVDGNQSLKVLNADFANRKVTQNVASVMEPDTDYILSFWMKTTGVGQLGPEGKGGAVGNIYAEGDPGEDINPFYPSPRGHGDMPWQQYAFELHTPMSANGSLDSSKLRLGLLDAAGATWFDDVKLVRVYAPLDLLNTKDDWLDTQALRYRSGQVGQPVEDIGNDLFELDGDTLSTTSSGVNINSHFVRDDWRINEENFTYRGRMRRDGASGIGVTFLSDCPNADKYYRVRMEPGASKTAFRFSGHVNEQCDDVSTVESYLHVWTYFEIDVRFTGGSTEIEAYLWNDGSERPDEPAITCSDDSADRLTTGTVGVWSMKQGMKRWEGLEMERH